MSQIWDNEIPYSVANIKHEKVSHFFISLSTKCNCNGCTYDTGQFGICSFILTRLLTTRVFLQHTWITCYPAIKYTFRFQNKKDMGLHIFSFCYDRPLFDLTTTASATWLLNT